MKTVQLLAVALVALSLTACQKRSQVQPDVETPPAAKPDSGASTSGLGTETPAVKPPDAGLTQQQQALAALRERNVVYFDFDSNEIRGEYVEVVAAHAAYLLKYPAARVRLEGHTDERGSREYNIGLGERRAQAVRNALLAQGVADAQVVTVSYGEERPAAEGADEQAHAQNRRVEIVHPQ